jgi:glycerophosphoryl diester phosphodiesterase
MKSKVGRLVLSILGVLILLLALGWLLGRRADEVPYYADGPFPLVIAHQGGDGLWPGDTMYAFQHAADLGADVLEMDLHVTKDGVLVLMHDETVDRTTDGTGEIGSLTLDELKQLDAGYDWSDDDGATTPYRGQGITVPTLEEVFQAFPGQRMLIEIKQVNQPINAKFCDLIHQYDLQDRVMVAAFSDPVMDLFREDCPGVATSASQDEGANFILLSRVLLGFLSRPAYQSLQVPEESSGISIMNQRFVRSAHRSNLRVEPWTIDDPDKMREFIGWGVDGLITDRPDLMLEVLGR